MTNYVCMYVRISDVTIQALRKQKLGISFIEIDIEIPNNTRLSVL